MPRGRIARTEDQTIADFWARVDHGAPSDCWPFRGKRSSKGYGSIWWKGRDVRAHRLAFFLAKGQNPPCVCHACDNPPCCNPAHLFAGDHAVNAHDRGQKKRGGDQRGEKHSQVKLNDNVVRALRRAFDSGAKISDLAREQSLHPNYVRQIVKRIRWRHLE